MTTVVEFYIPEKSRKYSVQQLSDHFEKNVSKTIEQGFYDFSRQYCVSNNMKMCMAHGVYKDSVQNFIFNCEENCRTIKKYKKQVANKKYNPYNFAFLHPYELDEDKWIKIIVRKNTTEEKLNNLPTIEWKPCKTCKSIEYFYCQLQTRSADEPMTTFYICKKCDRTYRVNN